MIQLYRLQMGFVQSNKNFGLNVFHFTFDDSLYTTPFDAALDLCTIFNGTVIPTIQPLLGSDVNINLLSAKKVKIATAPNMQPGGPSANLIVNVPGTALALTISSAVAACFTWVNADDDARMGRTFIGGPYQGALIEDVWSGAYPADAAVFINAMIVPLVLTHGPATFVKFDRKNHTMWPILTGALNPKPSGFNKRTLPVT